MSKRQFKTSANSARAGAGLGGFGKSGLGFGSAGYSTLSYVQVPPDYTTINDANVVVAFKNLAKKDGTTKAKALEDLQTYLSPSDIEIEDGVLEAWVKLYPRLSIDSGRRVRQLANNINGQICSKCGKRTVKHLPRIAGPWLAATYDSDRSAARSAQEALSLVFPSIEKVSGLRRAFHGDILEFCREAVLNETIQTLSDERSVSPDDASATYARVVATSMALISSIVVDLASDHDKQQHIYEEIFGDSRFWAFVSYSDPGVRKSMHRLAVSILEKQPTLIELHIKAVSTAYIYKGLPSDQTGSKTDFTRSLNAITSRYPNVWTDAYSGKKSAVSRLRSCLKHGSQSSNGFWDQMDALLRNVPAEVVQTTYDEISELVTAARDGVTRKDERNNAVQAWPTYFTLVDLVSQKLSDDECMRLMDSSIIPILRQYLQPSPDMADWSVGGTKAAQIVSQITSITGISTPLETEWPLLASGVIETAKLSQPEQSKDFEKSQTQVAAVGERWAELQRAVFEKSAAKPLLNSFVSSNVRILTECIALLELRDGKPFGAAAVIEELVRRNGSLLMKHETFKQPLEAYLQRDVPKWIFMPSRRYILRTLYALEDMPVLLESFNNALHAILSSDESTKSQLEALQELLTTSTPEAAIDAVKQNAAFQDFVQQTTTGGFKDDASCFSDFNHLGALSTETSDSILSNLTKSLSITNQADNNLSVLEMLSKTDEKTLRTFIGKSDSTSEQLLPAVLRLEQSPDDDVANKASALAARLSSAIGGSVAEDKFSLIIKNLEKQTGSMLPIDGLLDLTTRLLGADRKISSPLEVLPSLEAWKLSLLKAIRPPNPSISIFSPLGGAVNLVDSLPEESRGQIVTDAEGLSQALRCAIYAARLLANTDLLDSLQQHDETRSSLFALLFVSVLLAEDSLSIVGLSGLWNPAASAEAEHIVMDFMTEANSTLGKYWQQLTPELSILASGSSEYSRFFVSLEKLREGSSPGSPMIYYSALASSKASANLFELHGHNSEQAKASEQILRECRSKKDTLLTAACIVGLQRPLGGTALLNRFCNELVADLTDLDTAAKAQEGLQRLILLNVILQTQDEITSGLPKQRLIFLIKRLVSSVGPDSPVLIISEIWKTLASLLPNVQDMYGEHWEQILSGLVGFWKSIEEHTENTPYDEGQVMLLHASLRLFETLRKLMDSDDPNDDLVEAMQSKNGEISGSLVHLLKAEGTVADDGHQPLMITHEILVREINRLTIKTLRDADELYPLLYAPSQQIQQGGFSLLHKHIPAAQEQISFDAALGDKQAYLPDELLSLILEAPTLDALANASFDRTMPTSLQGYLYSWRLLFDHFNGSSYRVKTDYINQLKDGDYLSALLVFTFDFLGHTRGRPVDASKFEIEQYTADTEPTPEKDVQWLLIHLYFLALTHIPSSVKTYYLDIRSRQTSVAVESWTAKYISPLIISSSLQAVAEWSDKSVNEDPEYEKMTVKVGMRSKEVKVSYLVDEQVMAIKVVLPEAYPLASAQCVGVSRVAVREEKWQSWLRNCQGVITFSNGSITDGLSAWRKNVTGALKGQTECAICYSIISADRQLPSKRCPTCRNLFHSSCLFKWFKTSSASTCPLCRNSFNFN